MTPSEAAKMTGRARTTILSAIKDGRVSATKDENGRWVLEKAEVLRAFSAPVTQSSHSDLTPAVHLNHTVVTQANEALIAELRDRIEDLTRQRDRAETRIDMLIDETHQLRLLHQPAPPPRRRWWQRRTD